MKKFIVTISIIVSYLVAIMLIGKYALFLTHWMFDSRHDGFAGNFIGGIVGAFTAYFIARYQIHRSEKFEMQKQKKLDNAILRSLLNEIKFNKASLEAIIDFSGQSKEITIANLNTHNTVWNNIRISNSIGEILTIDEYNELSKMYYEIDTLGLMSNNNISTQIIKSIVISLDQNYKIILERLKKYV